MRTYSEIINSVKFQLANKRDLVTMLEYYAENTENISNKDFSTIFRLYAVKENCIKDFIIKNISQKTLVNAWNI